MQDSIVDLHRNRPTHIMAFGSSKVMGGGVSRVVVVLMVGVEWGQGLRHVGVVWLESVHWTAGQAAGKRRSCRQQSTYWEGGGIFSHGKGRSADDASRTAAALFCGIVY